MVYEIQKKWMKKMKDEKNGDRKQKTKLEM